MLRRAGAISGGVADSINPRTVGPARYRATTRKRVVSVMLSTIGGFTVTLAAGVLLTVGPGRLLLGLLPHPQRTVRHVIELVAGVMLWPPRWRFGWGGGAWRAASFRCAAAVALAPSLRAGRQRRRVLPWPAPTSGSCVGVGDLGRALLALLAPFGCRARAYDPWLPELVVRAAGAEPVDDLDALLAASRVVFVLPWAATKRWIRRAALSSAMWVAYYGRCARPPERRRAPSGRCVSICAGFGS